MASSARLERLRKLLQPDLDALPDRAVPPEAESESVSDEDSGGVSLEPSQSKTPSSKHTATDLADSNIKQATAPVTAEENLDQRFVWVKGAESSYNPNLDSMRPSTDPPKAPTAPPATDLQRGDLVSAGHHFTPIQALARYPYKFCNKNHMQNIASAFFDQGKFWERVWDLYYVWDIEPAKPLILVRESQVQALLKEINAHLKLGLKITDQQREEGLVARFLDHPRCLPRYLGRSHSREEYDTMVDSAPSDTFRAAGEPAHPQLEDRSLEAFKQLMEELWDIQKAKNKASKAKKQQERLGKQKSMTDQFKRAQRYVGLRPGVKDVATQAFPLESIDPSLPAPFVFEQSVVFVCIDVESWERAHHMITEVGVATLDTRDLVGVPPGPDGEAWRKKIRARHFRINEHRHLVNSAFVTGYPDGFDFGESTFVPLEDAAQHVAACFHAPFGAHHTNGAEAISTLMSEVDPAEKRNIIFLGHDTLGDVRYLQQLGYDPMKVENIIEALDTAVMYRVWHRDLQATNLGKILMDFDIPGFKLHNAGNDAVFTLQVMLAICVREATIRGTPELDSLRSEEQAARLAAAVEDAQQRVKDEAQGWSDNEIEGDGGVPVPLAASDMPKPMPAHANSSNVPQYDGPYEPRGRGNGRGGRGRGDAAPGNPTAGENRRGGHHENSRGYRAGSERGSYRGAGRGQLDSRGRPNGRGSGQGSSRGRGRGRGLYDPNNPSEQNNVRAEPQVKYYW